MRRKLVKTEIVALAAILFGIGLLIDIITGRFEPMSLFFSIVMMMVGWRYRRKGKKKRGAIVFVIGALICSMQLFSSAAVQLLLVACILYVGYELLRSRRDPVIVQLETKSSEGANNICRSEPFLKNTLIGQYRVMDRIYELDDINIRYGIGDIQIDLTTAMIPEGEAVIVIHGLVGNIRLYLPYDVECSLNHSMLFGHISLLGQTSESGWNQNIRLQTEHYQNAKRRVKIITSLLVGDTEVRYV